MYKTKFKSLLKSIGQLPLETACPLQLANICFGYRHLLLLSYTDPMITREFGKEAQAEAVTARMLRATDLLAATLDQEMSPGNRAYTIVILLSTLTFQFNPGHMEVAFNAMDEFLQMQDGVATQNSAQPPLTSAATQGSTQPPPSSAVTQGSTQSPPSGAALSSATDDSVYRCKILCYHYYFKSDEPSRRQAEAIIDGWVSELTTEGNQTAGNLTERNQTTEGKQTAGNSTERNQATGTAAASSWPLPLSQALERLETLVMYSDMVGAQRYEKQLHRILEHYVQDPRISKEIHFLSIVCQAGYFNRYPKQMEQIIDYVMQRNFSIRADDMIRLGTGMAGTGMAGIDRADADRAGTDRADANRAGTDRADTGRAETGMARQCSQKELKQAIRFYALAVYLQQLSQH